jgi:integrase
MLTAAQIRKLKPRARRYTVTDAHGLGLEVMPSGSKIWRHRFKARTSSGRVTIGRWPGVTLEDARRTADLHRVIIASGKPVTVELLRDQGNENLQVTVSEFGQRYIHEVLERDRKNPRQLISMLKNEVFSQLGSVLIADVVAAQIRSLIFRKRDQGKPAAAAALRNLIKRMWDYAIVCGAATVNPAHATPLKFIAKKSSRNRTLSRKEVGRFVNILLRSSQLSADHKRALQLILLTMVRKSELRLAQWRDVDFASDEWEIPAENSKTGKPHIVYLSQQARGLLWEQSPYTVHREQISDWAIFPAAFSFQTPMSDSTLNRALARVKWGMPHFTIHDLRRTAATLLSEEGFAPDVIEKALNHTIKGVRGVYNRAEYSEPRKQMLQAWADLIDKWRAEA